MISVISFLKLQWTLNGAVMIVFSDLQESKGNIGVAIDEMTSLGGLGSVLVPSLWPQNAPGYSREEGHFPFDQKFRDFRCETEWNGKSYGKCFRKFRNSNRLRFFAPK